jgi:hypothetical protein
MRSELDNQLYRIYRETDMRVNILSQRVAENVEVMAALDFSRWLLWSGFLDLLEAHSCDGPYKIDGAHLRWKCKELQSACQERFRTNDSEPHLTELQLQSINEKLNTIAGYLATAGRGRKGRQKRVKLKVISGGADDHRVQPTLSGEAHVNGAELAVHQVQGNGQGGFRLMTSRGNQPTSRPGALRLARAARLQTAKAVER